MTSTVQTGIPPKSPYDIPVVNGSGETAPPYAVLQIIGSTLVGTTGQYTIGKPTGVTSAKYLINTPEELGAGHGSVATDKSPVLVAITGTPAFNQEIGPVVGSWAMGVSGSGYIYLGGLAGGVGRVAAKAGTSAGDDFPLVKMLNSTGGLPRPFGTIVGYGSPVDPPPATQYRIPTFVAAAPTTGKPFAVLLDPVLHGEIVDAAPVGIVAVQINLTDAAHEFAEPITGDYAKLQSGTTGQARIIWREKGSIAGSGTLGLQWARVRLDPLQAASVAAVEDPWGVVYSTISAASGARGGPIAPGNGLVTLYLPPESGAIGTPWTPGPPISCETSMFETSPQWKVVIIRKSRQLPDQSWIYRAIAQGCKEQPSSG